jgi:hypothetical protein
LRALRGRLCADGGEAQSFERVKFIKQLSVYYHKKLLFAQVKSALLKTTSKSFLKERDDFCSEIKSKNKCRFLLLDNIFNFKLPKIVKLYLHSAVCLHGIVLS